MHGNNHFGEAPEVVSEHYSGMIPEPLCAGPVIRVDYHQGKVQTSRRCLTYDHGHVSKGHTWLPINLELGRSRQHLFASFAGFRPRLLPEHVASAYSGLVVDPKSAGYVPPLIMRLNAETLKPDTTNGYNRLYVVPQAFVVAGDDHSEFVVTFSPEKGLSIYPAEDLSHVVCEAHSSDLMTWGDSHFRPEPAHMAFVAND